MATHGKQQEQVKENKSASTSDTNEFRITLDRRGPVRLG